MLTSSLDTASRLIGDQRYAVPIQTGVVVAGAFHASGVSCRVVRANHLSDPVPYQDDLLWSWGVEDRLPSKILAQWDAHLRDVSVQAASKGRSVGSGVLIPRGLPAELDELKDLLIDHSAHAWVHHAGWLLYFVWFASNPNGWRSAERGMLNDLFLQSVPGLREWAEGFGRISTAMGTLHRSPKPKGLLSLSPAEQQVFDLLMTGLTEKEVAQKLGRAYNTVHAHVKAIYRKKCVTSRADLLSDFMSNAMPGLGEPDGRA